MALYDRKCPACGRVISQRQTPIREGRGFPCPACGRALKSSILPLKLTIPITAATLMSLCFWLGLRGSAAVLFVLLASLPLYFSVYTAIGLIFPPGLELAPEKSDPPGQATH